MEKDVRMEIANEIDSIQIKLGNESVLIKRTLLREKSKVLLDALIKLNDIQDKIINL